MPENTIFETQEAARCLLCEAPPCTAACPKDFDPAALVHALRFENRDGARQYMLSEACSRCKAPCERACIQNDFPVRLRKLAGSVGANGKAPAQADLSVSFCGIRCENPFFLSSSVVASSYEMCASALRQGWAGVVFKTIGFIKPNEISPRFAAVGKEGTPFVGFRNLEQIAEHALETNLGDLMRLKEEFPEKVICASIMGENEQEWEDLARLCQQAGADLIECNFSCPHMSGHGLGCDVGQDPALVRRYTEAVRRGTGLPVLAKMTPNLGNMEPVAMAAVEGGASGIAAINTVKSISGLDLSTLAPPPYVHGKSAVSGYSGKAVKPIALRFVCDMASYPGLRGVPLSGMGGIETWRDAAEFLALGCTNVQVTTAVMEYGYGIIRELKSGLAAYLAAHGCRSLSDFCGAGLSHMVSPDELDRESVCYPTFDKDKCVGCGRCYVSCRDGGHQAIIFDEKLRRPRMAGKKCVGCQLCRLVCPVGAVGSTARVPKRASAAS